MFPVADRKFKRKFGHTVIMNCFSLKAYNAMIPEPQSVLKSMTWMP